MSVGLKIAATLAGVVVGGGIVAALAMQKGRELEVRGALLSASLEDQGNALSTLLTARGSDMQAHLHDYAVTAANDHLAQAYGLTPERMAGLQRLATSLGVS